jgi:DNA-binding NarL/FixJ family response regulator
MDDATPQGLTVRQRRIIALLDSGAGDDQVARTLGVAVRTVRKDVAALMQRFGVNSRFALGSAIARSIGEADTL